MYVAIPAKKLSTARHKGNADEYRVVIRKLNPDSPWPWPLRCTTSRSRRTIRVVNLSTAKQWADTAAAYRDVVSCRIDGLYAGRWVRVC